MSNARRDENGVPTMQGVLDSDGVTPQNIEVDSSNHTMMVDDGSSVVASVVDSYTDIASRNNSVVCHYSNGSSDQGGQSFAVSSNATLDSCQFYVNSTFNTALPAVNAVANIYAHSGVYGETSIPTGSPLAVSDDYDLSAISNNTYRWITLNFSGANRISLSAGSKYCVSFQIPSSLTGALEAVTVSGVLGSGSAHVGNAFRFNHGGTWQSLGPNGLDLFFYVYGIVALPTGDASRDENSIPTLLAASSSDGITPIPLLVNSSGALLIQST